MIIQLSLVWSDALSPTRTEASYFSCHSVLLIGLYPVNDAGLYPL